jgi:glutathione-regulated potassium-efflux system ancillary protein KefG
MSPPSPGVLVLFAHPALQKSRINRRLMRVPQELEGVTFHDLYDAYPRLDIDVRREQALLTEHHTVVLQHPFYWYSTPAILKEWQDLVLEHGWAYGSEGTALRGKVLVNAITTGAREEAYCSEGYHRFTMTQLLAPLVQTAALCGMRYLPPFVVHGTHAMDPDELEPHARDYRRFLEALRDDRIDHERALWLPRINRDLDGVVRSVVEG